MKEDEYLYLSDFSAGTLGNEDIDRNTALEERGYVNTFIDGTIQKITSSGYQALSEYERAQDEMRKQHAERERQEIQRLKERVDDRRFNVRMTLMNAVVCGVIGALLTLLIEHGIFPLFR